MVKPTEKAIYVNIDKKLYTEIKLFCAKKNLKMRTMFEIAIDNFIKNNK